MTKDLFKLRMLAGAATGTILCLVPAAMAQTAEPITTTQTESEVDEDERQLEAVRVFGIRSSIESSLDAKREATSIVEAISAEDIGKLPDLSIADSLARLPGVTAQRVRGRAQQVSIRGLGPDFSLALLNGREVVSSGNNRGIEFDQFPSELISQGLVYKTPDARLAATGIAGAVDLRTIRPLDFAERQINVSAKYVYNDNGQLNPDFDEDGYRLFGSYIDQTEDGTFGWYIGGTVQSNPTQFTSRELKTGQFQTAIDPGTGLVYPSDNPRTGVVSREFERTSIAGALQFEPNNGFQATLDGFYTDTEDAGIFRGVETPLASWAGVGAPTVTGTPPGFADSATYANAPAVLRTDTEGNTAEIYAVGLNASYDFTDRLTVTADISRSELERNDIDYESYAGLGRGIFGGDPANLDDFTFTFDNDGEYSISGNQDYTDPNTVLLTDPGGWGQVGFIKEPQIEDELDQIRLEAEYDVDTPIFSSVVGGVLYTDREKSFDSNESFIRPTDAFVDGSLAIPSNAIIGSTDSSSIGLDIIAYNPGSFLTDGTYALEKATFDTEWVVGEEVFTYYLMGNIDAEFAGIPVRGNLGVQFIDTEQASTGTLNFGDTQTIQTVTEDYTHTLPSLNLSFEVEEDTFVRLAAAQTLTRARLDQIAANQGLSFNNTICQDTDGDQLPDTLTGEVTPQNTCFSVGGGNPFLRPFESTSYDIAIEKYLDDVSAFSFALFHKELSNWVIDRSVRVDGTQIIEAGGLGGFLSANPEVSLTTLSGPVNFVDGSITGFEATLRLGLDPYLPENLAGFGFNASYTFADSELNFPDGGGEIEIPGYSDQVWSGDVYYENYGFRARVSGRYRSGFLAEVQQFDGGLFGAQARDELIVDAQIGYEWNDGPLDGLSVNLEAFNLTNEPFITEDQTTVNGIVFPSRHEEYGTTYSITVAKKF